MRLATKVWSACSRHVARDNERITAIGLDQKTRSSENYEPWRRFELKKATWPTLERKRTEAFCWLRTTARYAPRQTPARVSARLNSTSFVLSSALAQLSNALNTSSKATNAASIA